MGPARKIIGGRVHYSVAVAARLLRTTGPKIREAMGRGDLQWTQERPGGPLFVTAASLVAYEARRKAG